MTVVQGTLLDINGAPTGGQIISLAMISPDGPAGTVRVTAVAALSTPVSGVNTGQWGIDLLPSASLPVAGSYYTVSLGPEVIPITVPASGGPYDVRALAFYAPNRGGVVSQHYVAPEQLPSLMGIIYPTTINGITGPHIVLTGSDIGSLNPPAVTERTLYVSASAGASDSNNGLSWGSPKATIAGAMSALGANPGTINVGVGTFTITSADASGNAVTLATAGQRIIGQGISATTIVVNVNCTWMIQVLAGYCSVEQLYVRLSSGKTATYGVGVSTPGSTGSAQGCLFDHVWVNCAGTLTAMYAVGPDHAGSSAMDIANTRFVACSGDSTPGTVTHGFIHGNGTSGNVTANTFVDCNANGVQYGITLQGGGIRWFSGQFAGNTGADIHPVTGTADPIEFYGVRGENGVQFLNSGYIGPLLGGIGLFGCSAEVYTPGDGVTIINHNATGALSIMGGCYTTVSGNTVFAVNGSGGSPARALTAVGVTTDNATPYPAASAFVNRTILAAQKIVSGNPTPNLPYASLIDGATGVVSTVSEVAHSTTTALAAADMNLMHAFTVGSAYTATLPTPVGVTGQQIGVRVLTSATNLLTLATAAGNIDGVSTRIMWAGETAFLESDGANWKKIAGRTIPMEASMTQAAAQSLPDSAITTALIDTTRTNNTGLMANVGSNRVDIKRDGLYEVKARLAMDQPATTVVRLISIAKKSGTTIVIQQEQAGAIAGGFPTFTAPDSIPFVAGDYVQLQGFQTCAVAATRNFNVGSGPDKLALVVREIPVW